MNTSLPVGHRDPRTEIVPGEYLYLAAQLIGNTKQDLDYWNTVKIPRAPSDRLPYEELRQFTVFLPLLLVAFAYDQFQFAGATLAFVCALPMMRALHNSMRRAILLKRHAWHHQDGGRYAFTLFLCKEFDLKPEDVTMNLVLKMCEDFKRWMAVATRLRLQAEEAERARRFAAPTREPSLIHAEDDETSTFRAASAAAVITSIATEQVRDTDALWSFNPATGLPMMMNSFVDVHGNAFGTDSIESMFNADNHESSFSLVHDSAEMAEVGLSI